MKELNSLKPCQKNKLHNIEKPEPVAQEKQAQKDCKRSKDASFPYALYCSSVFFILGVTSACFLLVNRPAFHHKVLTVFVNLSLGK